MSAKNNQSGSKKKLLLKIKPKEMVRIGTTSVAVEAIDSEWKFVELAIDGLLPTRISVRGYIDTEVEYGPLLLRVVRVSPSNCRIAFEAPPEIVISRVGPSGRLVSK